MPTDKFPGNDGANLGVLLIILAWHESTSHFLFSKSVSNGKVNFLYQVKM